MKLVPPLSLDEISVSHRVGKLKPSSDDSPAPLRLLLAKFATRRSKLRGIDAHNNKMFRRRLRVSVMNGDAPDPGPGHGREETTSTTSAGEEDDDDDWTADGLTHWGRVTHICVGNLTIIGSTAWSVPNHYLNQCWIIVNWTLRNKLQWNLIRNSNIFIQENAFESVVYEMAAILSRPQCVKHIHRGRFDKKSQPSEQDPSS